MAKLFKNNFSFEKRFDEAKRVLLNHPDRVPIICERSNNASKDCPDIDKKKYLVPRDLTLGQFIYVIRNRLNINCEKAIFLFINNNIFSSSSLIGEIYEMNRDADLFLYIKYSFENTFG